VDISKFDDNKLLSLFNNVLDHIEKGKRIEEANSLLSLIEKEWKKRLDKYLFADEKTVRPNVGMLQTIGYKVGNDGLSQLKREILLNHIIQIQLPFCQSPSYMAEWGHPNSKKRYTKLVNVLNQLIFKKQNIPGFDVAVGDWKKDLSYVKEKWRPFFIK